MATLNDVRGLCAAIVVLFPNASLADETPDVWLPFLAAIPADVLEAALREYIAAGNRFPPGVSDLVALAAARVTDAPEWDEVWQEIDRLIRRYGSTRRPPEGAFSHPAVAAFVLPAWKELCLGPAPGTSGFGTHYAQQREAYKALSRRAERSEGRSLVGALRRSEIDGNRVGLRRLSDPGAKLLGQ